MTRPTLSLCMIVRDEERHIARALDSVRGLIDEIVVVDTGSRDATMQIALSYGARAEAVAWQDDFSQARNYAIECARGDWILSLDADEAIANRDHAAIREAIANPSLDAIDAIQRTYFDYPTAVLWTPGDGGYEEGRGFAGFCDVECIRLFRRQPWIRFSQRLHEVIVSVDATRTMRRQKGSWVIHHFGKVGNDGSLTRKWERYVSIGKKKIEDAPMLPQAHYEMGVQYLELDRPAEALPCFHAADRLTADYRQSLLLAGICEVKLGIYDAALSTLERAAENPLSRVEAAIQRAEVLLKLKRVNEAIATLGGLCTGPEASPAAMVVLAVALNRRGQAQEARTWLDRAIELAPDDPQARCERALQRQRAGDAAGAMEDANRAGTSRTARLLRARLLLMQRKFADALHTLKGIEDLDHPERLVLEGGVALGLREYSHAAACFNASFEARPSVEAALNLAVALESMGDVPGALRAIGDGLRIEPDHPSLLTRHRHLRPVGSAMGAAGRAAAGSGLDIVLWHPQSIPYDAETPRTRGLGGTESAVVYLAEALAARGHTIAVLNNCPVPGLANGVTYARWEEMAAWCERKHPDALVAVRHWRTIGQNRFAPLQIFWTGDAYDQPFLNGIDQPGSRVGIDWFALQSEWQASTFTQHRGIPAQRVLRVRCGVAPALAQGDPGEKVRARRLVYASTPYRGLETLLDLFPRIRARCPDAQLHVFSSMRVYGVDDETDRRQFGRVYEKADQPGVVLQGAVPQTVLARALADARVMAYPNTFAETFCIAAAEAMAAGCPVVTSAIGALPETVGEGGILIEEPLGTSAYQQAFVDACVGLLVDDERWQQLSDRARHLARQRYSWPTIAEEWEEEIGKLVSW